MMNKVMNQQSFFWEVLIHKNISLRYLILFGNISLTDQIGNPCWGIDSFLKKYYRWIITFGCFYDISGIVIVISDPVACVQTQPRLPSKKSDFSRGKGRVCTQATNL